VGTSGLAALAWRLVSVATVLSLSLRHERAGTPPEQRGGVSILPGPVVLPAAGFLLAKGLDYVAGFAIGTTIVFWGHVLFALFVLAWIG